MSFSVSDLRQEDGASKAAARPPPERLSTQSAFPRGLSKRVLDRLQHQPLRWTGAAETLVGATQGSEPPLSTCLEPEALLTDCSRSTDKELPALAWHPKHRPVLGSMAACWTGLPFLTEAGLFHPRQGWRGAARSRGPGLLHLHPSGQGTAGEPDQESRPCGLHTRERSGARMPTPSCESGPHAVTEQRSCQDTGSSETLP